MVVVAHVDYRRSIEGACLGSPSFSMMGKQLFGGELIATPRLCREIALAQVNRGPVERGPKRRVGREEERRRTKSV